MMKSLFLLFSLCTAFWMHADIETDAIRLYSIKGQEAEVPNQKEDVAPLRVSGKPQTRDHFYVLDKESYRTAAPTFSTNRFSISVWVRPFGIGTGVGNVGSRNGMIVCSGSGYYDGWRIFLQDWQGMLPRVEIGRKQGGAFGVDSREIRLSRECWNHLAVTWDGQKVILYVNGLQAGVGSYAGEMVPAKGDLRIGFAGAGVGSLLMATKGLTISSRPWKQEEIVSEALSCEIPDRATETLRAAQASFGWSFPGAAEQAWKRLGAEVPALSDWCKVNALRVMKREDCAENALTLLRANPALSPLLRGQVFQIVTEQIHRGVPISSALLCQLPNEIPLTNEDKILFAKALVDAYLREKKSMEAIDVIKELLLFNENQLPLERVGLQIQWAEILSENGKHADARAVLAKIQDDDLLPVFYRRMAQLAIAHCFSSEKKWDEAIAAYRVLKNATDLPSHILFELERCITQCERSKAGKTPDDPHEGRHPLHPLPVSTIHYFVSPDGDDAQCGDYHYPFATLERARDAVNAKKRKGTLPRGGATIYLRGGRYAVTNTFQLSSADSGSSLAPIVYRAWKDERPIFDGGFEVRKLRKVRDRDILDRLPEKARGRVYVSDVKAQGYASFEPQCGYGYGIANETVRELFEDGNPLPISRWPNEGMVAIESGNGAKTNRFVSSKIPFERWAKADDLLMNGYWRYLWAVCAMRVKSLDAVKKEVCLETPPPYGILKDRPFYVFNLLEEIDQPGEWFLDRDTGKLYVWPKRHPWFHQMMLSRWNKPFIQATQLRDVIFQGISFEYGQQNGMEFTQCANIEISGCEISRLGGSALLAKRCVAMNIFGNKFHLLGHSGMRVDGGNRRTLVSSLIRIENNEVGFFGRCSRTYNPAVLLDGCGTQVIHNYFHDAPSSAMRIEGNDHLIEFNRVERVVQESDDQGGIDMWGNPSYRGVVIRYNLWEDIGGGTVPCGQGGIRFDDAISGIVVYGNRFIRTSNGHFGGVQIHGGHYNVIDNNLFQDCQYGISFSPWGMNRWTNYLQRVKGKWSSEVNVVGHPYCNRYPELRSMNKNPDCNLISRNLMVDVPHMFYRRPAGTQDWENRVSTSEDEVRTWSRMFTAPIPAVETMGCYPHPRAFHPRD